jgi:arginyl-tRNA synthetase
VKADAVLDALEENARQEVAKRHPDLDSAGQQRLGHMIAAAALRFFMLR